MSFGITAETVLLSVALGMDAFSVALGIGACRRDLFFRPVVRLAWHFGFFQFAMPLIGAFIGHSLTRWIGRFAPYAAALILAGIALNMFRDSFRRSHRESVCDYTRGGRLVMLSFATSIDALGVGLGLGMLSASFLPVCIVIGLTAMLMTAVGMLLGYRGSRAFGPWAERLGATVLLVIALKLLAGV